jgi:hypothetical protein
MSRKKRYSSRTLEKAQTRLAAVKSIDPTLDLGNGFSVQTYATLLEDARSKLEQYNTSLSLVDVAYTDLSRTEKALAEWSEQMLIAVAYHYGKSSNEYKMAGGTRRSDRKRRPRKTEEATAVEAIA